MCFRLRGKRDGISAAGLRRIKVHIRGIEAVFRIEACFAIDRADARGNVHDRSRGGAYFQMRYGKPDPFAAFEHAFGSQFAAHGAEFFILPGHRLTIPLRDGPSSTADFLALLRQHGKLAFEWNWQPSRGGERPVTSTEPVTVDGYTSRHREPAKR